LVDGHAVLQSIVEPLLAAREAMRAELARLHRQVLAIARGDEVCHRLMTAPGVGAVVALTYRSGVDDATRFRSSRALGPYLGLTPRRYQSGETDVTGGISRAGDAMVRTALYEAATVILTRAVRFSPLKRWAVAVAARRGVKRARVALARKLATVLHRIWLDGTIFRWGDGAEAPTRAARRAALAATAERRAARGVPAGTREAAKPKERKRRATARDRAEQMGSPVPH
jgi:hypothetical protein